MPRVPGVVSGADGMRRLGVRLACLTNKPQRFAEGNSERKGLDGYFEHVLAATPSSAKARPVAVALHLRRPGHPARAHADGGRLQQRRPAARAAWLPCSPGDLRLVNHGQPMHSVDADSYVLACT